MEDLVDGLLDPFHGAEAVGGGTGRARGRRLGIAAGGVVVGGGSLALPRVRVALLKVQLARCERLGFENALEDVRLVAYHLCLGD